MTGSVAQSQQVCLDNVLTSSKKNDFVCCPRSTKETKEGQGRTRDQSVRTYDCEGRVFHCFSQCMSIYLSCLLIVSLSTS